MYHILSKPANCFRRWKTGYKHRQCGDPISQFRISFFLSFIFSLFQPLLPALFLFSRGKLSQAVTFLIFFQEVLGSKSPPPPRQRLSWLTFFCFPQSLQTNFGILPQIRSRPLPSTCFSVDGSLTLPLNAAWSALLTESLSKQTFISSFPILSFPPFAILLRDHQYFLMHILATWRCFCSRRMNW